MSKEKDIAEENDQPTLNSDAVQDNPELREVTNTEEQEEADKTVDSSQETEQVEVDATPPTENIEPPAATEALETSSENINIATDDHTKSVETESTLSHQETEDNSEKMDSPGVQDSSSTSLDEEPIHSQEESISIETNETEEASTVEHENHTLTEGIEESSQEKSEAQPTLEVSAAENDSTETLDPALKNSASESENEVTNEVKDIPSEEDPAPAEEQPITSEVQSEEEGSAEDADDSEISEHPEVEEEEVDYATLSKEEILAAVTDIANDFTIGKASKALNELKGAHDTVFQEERETALKSFLVDGADEADFDFKGDDVDRKIEEYLKIVREKRSQHFHQLEKQKETNLKLKEGLLEKLRALVHEEESTASINVLKELQEEWRTTGPVHPQHNKTLWANYHALVNQFYDQRSIYFELKELDRKKNLESKIEICVKAEELQHVQNFNEAVKKLNELHDEYKHIGPVPRDSQEQLWSRFKTASDNIYAKRKEFVTSLKETLNENLQQKIVIADKVQEFINYQSDKISGWNQKTKELLAIQKEWEAIGSMPKENAKEINKRFWGNFKTFFHHKSEFFKSLESKREENLQLKQALVDKAKTLQESEDWDGTANELKSLQNQWKEVGPVPEKDREPIYQAFKAACDGFFNKRREHNKGLESSYEGNLTKKEEVCTKLEQMAAARSVDPDQVYALQDEFSNIGFVPKRAIKSIQKRYKDAIDALTKNADNLDEESRNELSSLIRINSLRSGPNSDQKISRQEHALKRKITHLENDISTWKNNIGFFANSKNADELMKDFSKKIEDSEQKLQSLKDELRFISRLE